MTGPLTDVHAHLWPEDYLTLLEEHHRPVSQTRAMNATDRPSHLATRIAELDTAGIDRQLVSAAAQMPDLPQATAAAHAARLANDRCAQAVARHPDRLGFLAVLPLPHLDEAIAEARHALDVLGAHGVALTWQTGDRQITEHRFDPLFAHLADQGTTVLLHPGGTLPAPPGTPESLRWTAGALAEQTFGLLRWLVTERPRRFPRLTAVIARAGGAVCLLPPSLLPQPLPTPVRFDSHTQGNHAALRYAADAYGADRIDLGTDHPFARGPDLVAAVNAYRRLAPPPSPAR
ncbi:amidohydrolase family protein [Streptomyces sp. 71268]|uniref:amidohydrolase family protein n=1 Tax=Streptomyces sp. 71268 TaxID=3002640 RepID=UPI0023F88A27|nr:amidohydrolase family protein [Streptomyces sp. 71268]WEV24241.1 amidohydrolase family protein [Streptomyces sp. 71268]